MAQAIIYAFFGLVVIAVAIVGVEYCKLADKAAREAESHRKPKPNLAVFGIRETGTSMDDCEIYTLSPKALGL